MTILPLIRQHWKLFAWALVALLLVVQTFRLQTAVANMEAERAGRLADRSEYQRAQAEATSRALSEKMQKEAEYEAKADEADTRYADLSGQYRAAVLRYQAAQRAGGSTNMSGTSEAASGTDGPGGGAVLHVGAIMIPQADALICAENTARLVAAHEWAAGLMVSKAN